MALYTARTIFTHFKKTITDYGPVEFECKVYLFDVKTLNGRLECFDGENSVTIPFITGVNLVEACIDAMKAETVHVIAIINTDENITGKIMIKKIRLLDIKTMSDSITKKMPA
jgi:hypothetical protein